MNLITDRQTTWDSGAFPSQYDTIKIFEGNSKYYKHGDETFATKSALRRALSSEYGGAWIEEKEGKKRYFIDESGWFQRSIREVSKEEFTQKLETPSTWQKVLGIGLGILALAPGAIEFTRHIPKEAGLGLLALQQKSSLLGAVGYSCFPSSADAQALGTEFQVNTIARSSWDPSVSLLNNGGFVVSWTDSGVGSDQDGWGIHGQMYDADGTRIGTEFLVNTYTFNDQQMSSSAPLNDGGFFIAWTSYNQAGNGGDIYGQRYNPSGARNGTEFQINNYTSSHQISPSVATLSDGSSVVTWLSDQDGDGHGIYGQRYTAEGILTGAEFQINTNTLGHQQYPSTAPLNNGGFIVAWQSGDVDGWGVYGQRYDATGAQIGTEFQINTNTTGSQQAPCTAPLNNGGFVVAWQSQGQDGDGWGIYGQKYATAGARSGTEFEVNSYTTSDQQEPSIAPLNDGGFVITWTSGPLVGSGQDGDRYGIFGQRYDDTGTRTGAEFQVNTYTTNYQQQSSVAPLNDGGFVVVWASSGQDGGSDAIYGQRYNSQGTPIELQLLTPSNALSSLVRTPSLQSSLISSRPLPSSTLPQTSASTRAVQTSPQSLTAPSSSNPQTSPTNILTSQSSLISSQNFASTRAVQTSSPSLTAPSSLIPQTSSTNILTSQSSLISSQTSFNTLPSQTLASIEASSHSNSINRIYSIIEITYDERYPILVNGQQVGTYTISGGTGQINSINPNVIRMHFNPGYYPNEGDVIPLFAIPAGQGSSWQGIVIGDTIFECLIPRSEITGGSESPSFQVAFEGATSCINKAQQIFATALSMTTN